MAWMPPQVISPPVADALLTEEAAGALLPDPPPAPPRPIVWIRLDGRASPDALHAIVKAIVAAATARPAYVRRDPLVLEWGTCPLSIPQELL